MAVNSSSWSRNSTWSCRHVRQQSGPHAPRPSWQAVRPGRGPYPHARAFRIPHRTLINQGLPEYQEARRYRYSFIASAVSCSSSHRRVSRPSTSNLPDSSAMIDAALASTALHGRDQVPGATLAQERIPAASCAEARPSIRICNSSSSTASSLSPPQRLLHPPGLQFLDQFLERTCSFQESVKLFGGAAQERSSFDFRVAGSRLPDFNQKIFAIFQRPIFVGRNFHLREGCGGGRCFQVPTAMTGKSNSADLYAGGNSRLHEPAQHIDCRIIKSRN